MSGSITESIIGARRSTVLDSMTVSPDLRQTAHVALVRKYLLSRSRVVVVGCKRGNPYDGVATGTPVFSPEGNSYAYAARLGRKWFVVLDGKEQQRCDGVMSDSLTFSPDRTRFAYIALDGWLFGHSLKAWDYVDGPSHIWWGNVFGAKWYAMVDDRAGPRYTEVYDLLFTPDSQHVLHVARNGKKCFLVTDGSEGKAYDTIAPGSLRLSKEGQRVLYLAKRGRKELVVLDGAEEEPGDAIKSLPVFSPNGQRVAYAVTRDKKHYMIADGKAETPCDGFLGLEGGGLACVFSPDSKNLAYVARHGGKWSLVVNARRVGAWDGFSRTGPVFSPNSRRIAYSVVTGGKAHVFLGGHQLGQYKEIAPGGPVFSPDSKRLAYGAKRDAGWFVSIDGEGSDSYDAIGNIVFSADSRHVAYSATRGTKSFVVLDGKQQPEYDRILTMPKDSIFFDEDVLKYAAVRGGHVLFVEQPLRR